MSVQTFACLYHSTVAAVRSWRGILVTFRLFFAFAHFSCLARAFVSKHLTGWAFVACNLNCRHGIHIDFALIVLVVVIVCLIVTCTFCWWVRSFIAIYIYIYIYINMYSIYSFLLWFFVVVVVLLWHFNSQLQLVRVLRHWSIFF